jgi:exonuclease III
MNLSAPRPGVLFVSFNPHGLTGPKLVSILSWLREIHADGAILTETQSPSDIADLLRTQPGAGAIWPGSQIFTCPGSSHTEGVCIILGPAATLSNPIRFTAFPDHGRILRLDLNVIGIPVCLIGVYAPTLPTLRTAFFSNTLRSSLPTDGRPLLVTGDFNCVLSPLDCFYPPGRALPANNTRLIGGSALDEIMTLCQLQDPWRQANPALRAHTHWSAPASSGGRLDRWLVSSSFLNHFAVSSSILPAAGIRPTTNQSLFISNAGMWTGPPVVKVFWASPFSF